MIPDHWPSTAPLAVAFRHTTGREWWSRIVRAIAGPPAHCVLVWPSGTAWHATRGPGVEPLQLTPERIGAEAWELVPVYDVDAAALRRWCLQRCGARYDTVGALLYWTPLTSRDRWTCSEFAAEGLVACGLGPELLAWSQTPRRLRQALRARLRRTTPPRARAA